MKKQVKISFILFGLAMFFIIAHNAVYGIFKIEEPVFFTLAILSIFALIISIIYNLIISFRKQK